MLPAGMLSLADMAMKLLGGGAPPPEAPPPPIQPGSNGNMGNLTGFQMPEPTDMVPGADRLKSFLGPASAAADIGGMVGGMMQPPPVQPAPPMAQPFEMPNTILGLKEFLRGQPGSPSPYQPY